MPSLRSFLPWENPGVSLVRMNEACPRCPSSGSTVATTMWTSATPPLVMKTFEMTRPSVAAQAVGIARAAFEFARDYAKEREQFGRPIIDNQGVAFKLADMAMEIDAARLLTYRAAWLARNSALHHAEGSMSKLKAGETAVWVTEQAVQILGGYGYIRDFPVEKWYRDAKIYTIFEGTSEIQRLVIARALAGD